MVQLTVEDADGTLIATGRDLGGEVVLHWSVLEPAALVKQTVELMLGPMVGRTLSIVLVDGRIANVQQTWQQIV